MSGSEYGDRNVLLRSNSSASEDDLEAQPTPRSGNKGIKDLLKRLDRGFSNRRFISFNRRSFDGSRHHQLQQNSVHSHSHSDPGVSGDAGEEEMLGDFAPPEWALLLIGCLLGLATGLCVAAFNRGVSWKNLLLKKNCST